MNAGVRVSTAIFFVYLGIAIYYPSCMSFTIFGLINVCIICLVICCVIWVHILLSSQHKTGMGVGVENVQKDLEYYCNKIMNDFEPYQILKTPQSHLPVIFGRTVDSVLQQLLDFIVRDFIDAYLKEYAYDASLINDNIKEDIWGAIQNLSERLSRIDNAKLIACDLVSRITIHFERIRDAKVLVAESNHLPLFTLSPHLVTTEKELEYLQNISEVLIMFLLPRSYSLSPAKYFLREILAYKVLYPFVDHITDPDYFNRNVLVYIEAQKVAAAMHRRTFEYANSFEDFLKTIQKTNDVELLKSIRYDIVTKIMQATTLQNINRSKGLNADWDKDSSNNTNKSDINAAKKLRRYINQLTFAKNQCEKRLFDLGWDITFQMQSDVHKLLPLSAVVEHVLGRKYLSLFLETVASQGLVGYWTAVEELRTANRKNRHQLGAEIFYTFIRNPTAEIKVDKSTRKRMEAFLLGDKGPEVFYEVQQQVVQTIEDKYYQPFIISDFYKDLLGAIANEDGITEVDSGGSMQERQLSGDSNSSLDISLHVGDHSNYARRKLHQLQEKLNNKMQALQALRSALKPESRVLKILEKEVEWLEGEKRQLEAHISRTEIWGENLGKWRAIVQSAEVGDEKEIPQFVIVVHMLEGDTVEGEEISTGWVVLRSLTQFQELHRKLRPLCSNIRNVELPSQPFKFLFSKSDKNSLEKAKIQIQKYLEFVLEDDRLNQCEAIYSFLSPSSEHLKHSTPSPKKSKFSFATLFKSGSSEQGSRDNQSSLRDTEEEDISQCLDAPGGTDIDNTKLNGHPVKFLDDSRDTIAEPLYSLMSETFDMRGVFKYLRKTLIAFVQVTYGRTINRQIRDSIAWCFSEQMLLYYTTLVIKTWWPSGVLANPISPRSVESKAETQLEARDQFVSNVPEILMTLVGASAAKSGAGKVFDTLQNKNMNKQLFYDLMEVSLSEIFPELKLQDS